MEEKLSRPQKNNTNLDDQRSLHPTSECQQLHLHFDIRLLMSLHPLHIPAQQIDEVTAIVSKYILCQMCIVIMMRSVIQRKTTDGKTIKRIGKSYSTY
jgi:hypothetical protein